MGSPNQTPFNTADWNQAPTIHTPPLVDTTSEPRQFSTGDNTLSGAVDGENRTFTLQPNPTLLLYDSGAVAGAASVLLFRNGLIQAISAFNSGQGWFDLPNLVAMEDVAALFFSAPAPSALYLSQNGLTANGGNSLYLTPNGTTDTSAAGFLLFRNGFLLTAGLDYVLVGPWIWLGSLVAATGVAVWNTDPFNVDVFGGGGGTGSVFIPGTPIQPTDTWIALIVPGSTCSTANQTITGSVNGVNPTFTLPSASAGLLLFVAGVLAVEGEQYTRSGNTVTFFHNFIPPTGVTLTAQLLPAPIAIAATYNRSLFGVVTDESLVFRNGLFMAQPGAAVAAGNTITMDPSETPQGDDPPPDVITCSSFIPQVAELGLPPLNEPVPMTPIGQIDGTNPAFALPTTTLITQIDVFRNGQRLTRAVDYLWSCSQLSSAGPWTTSITMLGLQIPQPGDPFLVEAYLS